MANLTGSFEGLSLRAFACILQFFNLVNEQDGLLSVVQRPSSSKSTTSYITSSEPIPDISGYVAAQSEEVILPEVKAKVHPEKLEGVGVFWKIVQEARNKEVVEKSRDFLNRLYTQLAGELQGSEGKVRGAFIETYLNKLATIVEVPGAQKAVMLDRMIGLMIDMIDESERKGTGGVRSHTAILKGEKIDFVVHNRVTSGKGIPQKMEVEIYSNTTIWELKVELGKFVECSAECMRLSVNKTELKDTDHGKTIGEFLQQKRSGVLHLERKPIDDAPKVPLLNEDQSTLTEPARRAFALIFSKFAKNGKMNAEGAAELIRNTTGEQNVGPKDSRIKAMMKTYDKDKDGAMDLDGFLDFYRDSLVNKKEDTVRNNLHVHGFRNDLKKFSEVETAVIDTSTLPRYILSCNPKSFELLFRALDIGGASAELVWDLIGRLTTNEGIYRSLRLLDNGAKVPDWPRLIDTTSVFRLLYSLQILNSFLETSQLDQWQWQQSFIERGGFAYLMAIFLNVDQGKGLVLTPTTQSPFEKESIGLLCSILGTFVKSAACKLTPGLAAEIAAAQTVLKKHRIASAEKALEENEEQAAEALPQLQQEGSAATMAAIPNGGNNSAPAVNKAEGEDKKEDTGVDLKELFRAKKSKILWLKNFTDEAEHLEASQSETSVDPKQAEAIINASSRTEVWTRLIDMISAIIFEPAQVENTKIVRACTEFLCDCVLANNAIFPLAIAHIDPKTGVSFERLVLAGVLSHKSPMVRQEFAELLHLVCYMLRDKKMEVRPLEFVLKTALGNLPAQGSGHDLTCAEYFQLTCRLLDLYCKGKKDAEVISPKELLSRLVSMVKGHKIVETRNFSQEDCLLIGLLNTIRKLIVHASYPKEDLALSEGLLQELFSNCLFPSSCLLPSPAGVLEPKPIMSDTQKCKSKSSRTAAYKLLAVLCRDSTKSHIHLLKECLEPLCKSIKPHPAWGYVPAFESRSKLGYVGIENLGCVCYMISMMQQFYMIPSFRYGLLAADDKVPPTNKKPTEIDDNILHQMQKMFAFLELSERQSYNPSAFCYAFKDFDGNPTNTSVQQDAQEFLNLAFDRLEGLMRGTPEKYLVRSVFGGKTCSQVICKGGCGSVRKNYEDFYNLSVGVKGFKSLSESLGKYISGDTISDYFCEKCQKKVELVKRTCLHQLPNVLIIHLQRLIYNFDTQTNEKINSRLEFPKELSLEPYTVEGVESRDALLNSSGKEEEETKSQDPFHGKGEDYYRYKLAGVVVHIGTADAGHYYSYINTNRKRKTLRRDNVLLRSRT